MSSIALEAEMADAYLKEYANRIEHARWLTALSLGEMAGIVAYLDLHDSTMTLEWALAVLLLGLTAVVFIALIMISRADSLSLSQRLSELRAYIAQIGNDPNVAEAQRPSRYKPLLEGFRNEIRKNDNTWVEILAHALFALATLLTAVFLTFSALGRSLGLIP